MPFDDAALQEIVGDVTQLCGVQKRNAIQNVGRSMQKTWEASSAPSMEHTIAAQIEREVSSVIADVTRDLRIKRDEVILDEKCVRKAYATGLGKEWDAFICHASEDKDDFVR